MGSMVRVRILLKGCDDRTVFEVHSVTATDLLLLYQLKYMSEETSKYGCMPVFDFEEIK